MKILLLGEYSGFFKNLKTGFKNLGHEVILVAGGDGWKKIDGADYTIESKSNKFFNNFFIIYQYYKYTKNLKGFDIVLIINPEFFIKYIGISIFNLIKKHNNKLFLSACGDDVEFIDYGMKNNFRWWPYMDSCSDVRKNYYQTNYEIKIHNLVAESVEAIIPVSVEYALAWKSSKYFNKVENTIPLPIDTSLIKYKFIYDNDKIIFFHGLNRECFKGTKYIKEAMLNIKKKYPEEVECIIEGKLPLSEYLSLLDKTHIVLDQCKVYSYGSMNSLYSMSKGKILLGGMQKECFEEFNLEKSPVINIEPNVKQIESQMEYVIKNKEYLDEMSLETRNFVEKKHDCTMIAKRYIEVFEKYITK